MRTRVAIAGLGGVADRIHLPACRCVPEIEVVAAADPDPEVRARTSAKFTIPKTYADVDSMLAEARPDALIVGTPPGTHFEICSKALDAGVHVFCEKPFMSDLAQADQAIALAQRNKLSLRVNNQYRYMT